jgi:hypothetical protein
MVNFGPEAAAHPTCVQTAVAAATQQRSMLAAAAHTCSVWMPTLQAQATAGKSRQSSPLVTIIPQSFAQPKTLQGTTHVGQAKAQDHPDSEGVCDEHMEAV